MCVTKTWQPNSNFTWMVRTSVTSNKCDCFCSNRLIVCVCVWTFVITRNFLTSSYWLDWSWFTLSSIQNNNCVSTNGKHFKGIATIWLLNSIYLIFNESPFRTEAQCLFAMNERFDRKRPLIFFQIRCTINFPPNNLSNLFLFSSFDRMTNEFPFLNGFWLNAANTHVRCDSLMDLFQFCHRNAIVISKAEPEIVGILEIEEEKKTLNKYVQIRETVDEICVKPKGHIHALNKENQTFIPSFEVASLHLSVCWYRLLRCLYHAIPLSRRDKKS